MIPSKFWCETYIIHPVPETKFVYVVFVSWEIELFNHVILPFLLVLKWPYWPPDVKGLEFYKKINAILLKYWI